MEKIVAGQAIAISYVVFYNFELTDHTYISFIINLN